MFFNDWEGLVRALVVGPLAYVGLVLLLRVSGKRTLAKMNAFDLIVTVALGSTLATILLSKDVALAEGLTALGLLVALQYVITWASVHPGPWRRGSRPSRPCCTTRGISSRTRCGASASPRPRCLPPFATRGCRTWSAWEPWCWKRMAASVLQRSDRDVMETLRGVQNSDA